mmetsp:Transcript_116932/g.337943  ORF Transcript_116932/g.337943 Transcript_116932/m.337943 type:complete len:200 (-) Transcript_116932:570-1169(-)
MVAVFVAEQARQVLSKDAVRQRDGPPVLGRESDEPHNDAEATAVLCHSARLRSQLLRDEGGVLRAQVADYLLEHELCTRAERGTQCEAMQLLGYAPGLCGLRELKRLPQNLASLLLEGQGDNVAGENRGAHRCRIAIRLRRLRHTESASIATLRGRGATDVRRPCTDRRGGVALLHRRHARPRNQHRQAVAARPDTVAR